LDRPDEIAALTTALSFTTQKRGFGGVAERPSMPVASAPAARAEHPQKIEEARRLDPAQLEGAKQT